MLVRPVISASASTLPSSSLIKVEGLCIKPGQTTASSATVAAVYGEENDVPPSVAHDPPTIVERIE